MSRYVLSLQPLSLFCFFRDIRLGHSIFALPFAAVGYVLSGASLPEWKVVALLCLCMIFARSFGMGLNRYLDRNIDGKNPRTSDRMIPSGQMSEGAALVWSLTMGFGLILSACALNSLAGFLSLPLLGFLGGYSFMKRVSYLTHWYLGLCLGLAPIAVAVALTAQVNLSVFLTALGVVCWVAGFDILYSLQDIDFDRKNGLYSIPAKFDIAVSLNISRCCFSFMVICLAFAGFINRSGLFYYLGVLIVACILFAEHWVIRDFSKHHDNQRINQAFFTMNGWLSILFYMMVQLDSFI